MSTPLRADAMPKLATIMASSGISCKVVKTRARLPRKVRPTVMDESCPVLPLLKLSQI